jgi:GNAT superfamily N-acetyltransferase
MLTITRTDSDDPQFIQLVQQLDAELASRDGNEHSFYAQFNKVDKIRFVVIAYLDSRAVACGALKEFDPKTMEVKRMFTLPEDRGKGIATMVLNELVNWAAEMHFERCVLETGKRQPEAIRLYEKYGFRRIPNYGQYAGIENSVCFEKTLQPL